MTTSIVPDQPIPDRDTLAIDADDSYLGVFGFGNSITKWLLSKAPELLESTPAELVHGLRGTPQCPKCGSARDMRLRTVEASGRLPRRWTWLCTYRTWQDVVCGGRLELKPRKVYRDPAVNLTVLLNWTRAGKTVDFQPNPRTGVKEARPR